jgi:nitrite reductase/ring-hydroxylating ferredoxin subunit
LSGAADWSDTHGKPQRVGALHALVNSAAALLYVGSYAARRTGNRGMGRTLSCGGFGLAFAGAFLGGELSYSKRVCVNHAPDPDEDLPQEFVKVLRADELHEGELHKATAGGTDIMLFKQDGRIRCLAHTCAHAGGPLAEGKVVDGTIECPWHGSRFCLDTGAVAEGPATHPQPVLDVQVRDGDIWVKARS